MKYLILTTNDGVEIDVRGPFKVDDELYAIEHAEDISGMECITAFIIDEETAKTIGKRIGDDVKEDENI